MKYLKENSINVVAAKNLSENEIENKIVVGEFYSISKPEYTDEYQRIIDYF